MSTFTAVCNKDSCYWRATTENAAQAFLWATEHEDLYLHIPGREHSVSVTMYE